MHVRRTLHIPRLPALVGVVAALSLLTAACGDDDDDAAATDTEQTDEATTTTEATDADAAADSTQLCDASDLVDAVESGPDEGTLDGMTDDPVATAASSNPVLTTLVTAVGEAGLVDTLNSAEQLTVFAPTDCAFAALDPATLDAALADPTGLLTQVLGFHVVAGERLSAADLAGATELTTFTGATLPIGHDGDEITVGGDPDQVVVPDIQTANATVHLFDAVMLPPAG
jgi:transforming growth factor-beta-induced protein